MDSCTEVVAGDQTRTKRGGAHDATRRQIRGSSLLLAGRLLSVGIGFVAQVLIVRYLATAQYGAWAYALSVVTLCEGLTSVGLNRAASRFVPMYHEKREYDTLFGTIILVFGTILLSGFVIIAAFHMFPEQISRLSNKEQEPLALLFILIFLIPVDGVDGLLMSLFASFARPRAIFFRKHVLSPGLKLGVVLLLIMLKSKVTFLAYGYLVASAVGVLIYSWVLTGALRRQRLLEHFRLAKIKVPAREFFAFTVPLMTSDLVPLLMYSSTALLLGYFHNLNEVAFFRVVLPAATMCTTVIMRSFTLLYTPVASRLFAKEDYRGINDLYWRTATWMAVLSFPIFALTFSMARPLTIFLYGARYEPSSILLALLALGNYLNVALGFNGLTIQILGKVRYVVVINLLAALTSVAANLLLIPRFGALGAAIGTSGTLIVQNILMQAGLRLVSGISLFETKYLSFYLNIALAAAALLAIQFLGLGNIYALSAVAGLMSLLVLALCRKKLKVAETFPELLRLPLMRVIFT